MRFSIEIRVGDIAFCRVDEIAPGDADYQEIGFPLLNSFTVKSIVYKGRNAPVAACELVIVLNPSAEDELDNLSKYLFSLSFDRFRCVKSQESGAEIEPGAEIGGDQKCLLANQR